MPQPIVLILEDLHWADAASLDLLRFVARAVKDRPLLHSSQPGATMRKRNNCPAFCPHSSAKLGRCVSRCNALRSPTCICSSRVVTHWPLAKGKHLAIGYSGIPRAILSWLVRCYCRWNRHGDLRTDGRLWHFNRPTDFGLPPLARQVIEQRLARLDETTLRILEYAAIVGQDASLFFLQTVVEASDDQFDSALEQAIAASIVDESSVADMTLRVRHALMREALYQRQSALRRRTRHRRVAELLLTDPAVDPVTLAHHFQSALDSRAVEWLVRAGKDSLKVNAQHDAIAHLSRAEYLARRFWMTLPQDAVRSRGRAHEMVGNFDLARNDYEWTLRVDTGQGDRRGEWQALISLGSLWAERDYERAGHALQQALSLGTTGT